jgi:ribonucleoside-triphosphate reductase
MIDMKLKDYILRGATDKNNASETKNHLQMLTIFGSQAIREFIMNDIVSQEAKDAHDKGLIYIHDSDFLGPYCNSIDPTVPLSGIDMPTMKTYPAKHFGSALDHIYSYTMYSQNHFGGAQSIDWFNWFLAPYLAKDNLSSKELKQELQKFFFNCNQVTRTGGKPPFINIGLRMECPKPMRDRQIFFDGKASSIMPYPGHEKMTYSHDIISIAAEQIYHTIMDILKEGMAGNIPFTYPLVATTIVPETDFKSKQWKHAMETTAHNGSLYFVNLKPEYMQTDGGDCDIVSSQCCRVRVKFAKVGGIWSGGEMGTGTNRIITLNLAAMGLEARHEHEFMEILDSRLLLAGETLLDLNQMVHDSIYKWGINTWLAQSTPDGIPYYDFSKRRLLIGTSFLHDMCVHMGYKDGLLDEEGNIFAQKVLLHIKDTLEEWMEMNPDVQWGIEAPPNESSNHFMAKTIIENNVGAEINAHGTDMSNVEFAPATHLPYDMDVSLPDKINAEAPFHKLCDGGNIFHYFISEDHPDPEGISELIQKMSDTDLGYFALSPTFSICENDHCSVGKFDKCPKCGADICDYMQRITGYIEKVSKFNDSKLQEWKTRKHYNMEEQNE